MTVVVQLLLPNTGYVVRDTITRDGREPYTADTFIDCRGQMSDTDAVGYVRAEIDALRMRAPSNVEHRIVLVHRTAEGDRALYVAAPLRGLGNPI